MPEDVAVGGVDEFVRRDPGRRYREHVLAGGHFPIADDEIAGRAGQSDVGQLAGGGVGRTVDGAAGLGGDDGGSGAGGQIELGDRRGVHGESDPGAVGGDDRLGFFGGVVGELGDHAAAQIEAVDAVAAGGAAVGGEDDRSAVRGEVRLAVVVAAG